MAPMSSSVGRCVVASGMRQGDLKAVMVPEPYGTGQWRLYNVVKDPGEAKDLSKKMPDKFENADCRLGQLCAGRGCDSAGVA